ncbi:hypothetical protein ABMY12_13340, partial [Vibrio vulnificus]|uniref:hypothetical protein n=1 Tax=Vibrio vulnificus TaxID=672 RepID=UPI004058F6D3
SKIVLDRHKKSETYKQVSDCLSSEGSVNRSLSDLHCQLIGGFFCLSSFSDLILKHHLVSDAYMFVSNSSHFRQSLLNIFADTTYVVLLYLACVIEE